MDENNKIEPLTREEKETLHEEVRTGEIRYRLDNKSRIKGGILQFVSLIIIVIITSLLTATVVSRKTYEDSILIDDDSSLSQVLKKSLENFENGFYNRTKIRSIYDEVSSSVVGVSNDPEAFSGESYDKLCSGVVMNEEGYILIPYCTTVLGAEKIYISTGRPNDPVYESKYIGTDPTTGVALVQVENLKLKPAKFADSNSIKVAQSVIAMGTPFGDSEKGTVTFGVISTVNKALDTVTPDGREVKIYIIETDSDMNRGNNGGPLVNMNGEVVGINSLKISNQFNEEMGSAITSRDALNITRSLINSGEELNPFLGVYGDIVNDITNGLTGFYVQRVASQGTADRAGIRPTDIILSVDDISVEDNTSLDNYISTKQVGDVVSIVFRRVDEVITVEATLYGVAIE